MRRDHRVASLQIAGQFVVDHVEFGNQYIELERDLISAIRSLQSIAVDAAAGEQMRLQSDRMQRNAAVAQGAQQADQRLASRRKTRPFVLDVVFVKHQPRIRIRQGGLAQRD